MQKRDYRVVLKQVVRYGIVGILNNTWGYCLYLLVTWLGMEPKAAVTLLYPISALAAYYGHARFSFGFGGNRVESLIKYSFAHLVGYLVNVLMLKVCVDIYGFPHQFIQGISIFVVAGVLFVLMRYFVFKDK